MECLKTTVFGAYNIIVAKTFLGYAKQYFETFDALAAKKYPDRVVGDMATQLVLSSNIGKIQAKASGKSYKEYVNLIDVSASVMDQIKKPFFFFSTMDDPFYGDKVIPFEH